MSQLDWKKINSGMGLIAALGAGIFVIEDRYVQASDYAEHRQAQAAQLIELRVDQLRLQRNALQAELFNLRARIRGIPEKEVHPDDAKRVESLEQAIRDLRAKMALLRGDFI